MGDRDGFRLPLASCGISLELMGEAALAAVALRVEYFLPLAGAVGSDFRGNESWRFYHHNL